MTAVVTLVAVGVTLAALAWLAETDAKRRRVFGVAPRERRRGLAAALAAVFLPGVLLLALGNGAGFVVWLGATTVAGWGVAALPPARWARLRARSAGLAAGACKAMRAVPRSLVRLRAMSDRIAALEARVETLERQRDGPGCSPDPGCRRAAPADIAEPERARDRASARL